MRVLFMGTPEFAVESLKKVNEKYEVVGVFTKVDKPNTRGKKIKYTPIKEYALENNIENKSPNINVVIASFDVIDVQIKKEGERRKRKNQTLSFPDNFSERYTE